MAENIFVKTVKKLIISVLSSIAEKEGIKQPNRVKIGIMYHPKEKCSILVVYIDEKPQYVLSYKDFASYIPTAKKVMYRGMGFDVNEDLKVWIDKFINMSASDNGYDITDCAYILFNDMGDLKANMYYKKELVQNLPSFMGIGTSISLDYIMQTS